MSIKDQRMTVFSIQYQRKLKEKDMLLLKKNLIKKELLLSISSVCVTKVVEL